jgi:putative oxidoreductase
LRIPAPLAILAVAAEFLGGLGLIVGLLSRVAALGIAVVIMVALDAVHWKFGFFIDWYGGKKGHGIEYHVLALTLTLIVIIKGAGAFSLDQALYQHVSTRNSVGITTGTAKG